MLIGLHNHMAVRSFNHVFLYTDKIQFLCVLACDDWPVEYLEFYPNQDKAKKWMADNLSDEMKELYLGGPSKMPMSI